ncbi:MAG: Eco57I restriction-modification methylase domain-containing protein, partial [Ignavibacteria bacterium]|nr:Eco57I restriction-modification methylase domain-containing protein [Ignavibacteria bacterium]
TLENNIKSGNSLIDLNFYDGELEFSGTERKIKPFNWQAAFPEVFKQGGFDCVIGNPPYRKERDSKDLILELKKSTIGKKYYEGKMDLWYFFLHKAIDLSKNGGLIGIITNSYWIMSAGSTRLINRIKSELIMRQVIDFDDIKVFENVAGKHMIHLYIKKKSDKSDKVSYIKLDKKEFNGKIEDYKEISLNYENIFINASKISFTNCLKIETKNAFTIDDLYEVSQGVVEAPDKLSRKSLEKNRNNNYFVGQGVFVISKSELNSLHLNIKENKIIRKYLNSHNVERYGIKHENEYLIYSDKEAKEKISKGEYPNLRKHLDKFKSFITSSNGPYGIHRPRDNKYFEQTKLLCKGMFRKPEFCLDEQKHYVGFSFSVIIQKVEHYSLKYLLGLLNSKYAEYWFNANGKKRGIGVDIGVLVFRTFPIPKIDFANPAEKKKHDEIVKHVVAMLELNKELSRRDSFGAKSKPGEEQERLKQRITYTDKKIDALVYELYGLTEEEIKIVEDEG